VNTVTGVPVSLAEGGTTAAAGASVAFSRDGSLLAAATSNGVWVWTVADGRVNQATVRQISTAHVRQVAFSPNGRQLAAAAGNSTLLWTTGNLGQAPHSQSAPSGNISVSVAFSRDGKLLAAATDSVSAGLATGIVQEWPAAKFGRVAKPLEQPNHYDDPDYSLTFSPNGRYLAVGGNEMTQLLGSATLTQAMPPISGWLTAFNPDGSIVSVETGKGVRLLDLDTGQVIDKLPASQDSGLLYAGSIPVAFSGHGTELAAITGNPADEIQLWHLSYLGTSIKNTVSYLCNQLNGQSLPTADWARYARGVPPRNACA
jgi:WD40 repeat protein